MTAIETENLLPQTASTAQAAETENIPLQPEAIEHQAQTVELTRQQAQAADPRSGLEFSLANIKQLAAEGLKKPTTLQRGSAYVQNLKPAFTYNEEGTLPKTEDEHYMLITTHITQQGLQYLIPSSHPRPHEISRSAALNASTICHNLHVSRYATPDLTKLGLYDLVIFCDDSLSMGHQKRFDKLKTVVRRIARIGSAYNPAGITIRFMNATNDGGFNGIITEEQVETCLDQVHLRRGTPLGTKLFQKVVQPLIVQKARSWELTKPVVVSVVTDGMPSEEDKDTLKHTILATKNELLKLSTPNGGNYGPSAVVFQIARVGTSRSAESFVKSLEDDPDINDLVFCTDESLDWALDKAGDQFNTWLTQVLAASIKR